MFENSEVGHDQDMCTRIVNNFYLNKLQQKQHTLLKFSIFILLAIIYRYLYIVDKSLKGFTHRYTSLKNCFKLIIQ